jgi:2-oxoglutarate ferredoxin oxidoreductase subunit alpha
LEGLERYCRYLDVDGDHIASRTLPGVHPKGAFFTRGSGHDKYGRYTEDSEAYIEVVDRLRSKIDSAGDHVPAPEVYSVDGGAPIGLVSVGGCHWAVLEARDELLARGVEVDYLRVRGFPFNQTVEDFLARHQRIFVVEQNRDEQLRKLLLIETRCAKDKLASLTYYGGQPLSKGHVLAGLATHLEPATVEAAS